ncbi:hypothetical protein UFOVP1052_18 [uncultured Caudovirales phage]|jgi:hypothetical protein|uniref:Uncharacterized protein n=1 Tax=uncultured Caudovirales phage TaxID=2100421 RepID=A0A6J5QFP6_9CAUD|nr:hypothetical protein UFOVP1052_18 [uncultured Caudovirales phage]
MSVSTTITVVGVKDTINGLRKIDPQLQKDFKAQATLIAQPAVQAGRDVYTALPLSGMKYKWTQRDRKLFPFTVSKAANGVKMRFDTRRNAVGVILIEQKDPAAAIFETAGRANANRLSNSLGFVGPGRTRLIGPAVYKARRGVEKELKSAVMDAMRTVQREL